MARQSCPYNMMDISGGLNRQGKFQGMNSRWDLLILAYAVCHVSQEHNCQNCQVFERVSTMVIGII